MQSCFMENGNSNRCFMKTEGFKKVWRKIGLLYSDIRYYHTVKLLSWILLLRLPHCRIQANDCQLFRLYII